MTPQENAGDEFAEFDLDEAQLDAIMERAEPAELVYPPRAAVTMTLGYGAAAVTTMTSTGTAPRNMAGLSVPVFPGR